ncbi:MAG: molecular chaperone DnaK [Deltaproteobacteria bacterium]|nr:molecular chaperone DnaK [Deltaproteobacteria bacterium]
MSKVIGIDLGTTNSVVAIMESGETKVIVNEEGARTTPSVVAWTDKGEILVGQVARRQAITNPENTVYSVKRFMGMKYDEIPTEIKRVPYKVHRADNGDAHIEIRGKAYAPPEISAKVLQKLKRAAEAYLGEEVKEAVITVPAYFNDAQRQATKDAGRIAGLEVKRIINEPTAAALAYGLDKKVNQVIAVYDFGGGTFDISVLEVGDGVVEVVSTNGDTHLGGDDFDHAIMQWLMDEFRRDTGIDVSHDKMVVQRLKEAAEKAKIELSSAFETEINLPFLTADQTGPKHLQLKMSRAKLEALIREYVSRSFESVRKCLEDGKKTPREIDEVVLVGGSIRIPLIQEEVKKFFGKEPNRSVNPDEVVAIGAAIQGGVLTGQAKDIVLLDVTPLSLGIETLGGVFTPLIPRNTTIPTRKSETFSTAADGQSQVEVHVLQGERKMAAGNKTLGRFILDGIPPAPRGVPQVEVTFNIDANGIVHVSAKDKATQREQSIQIQASSGLSETEINQMVEDAKSHEKEDEDRRKQVEQRNKLDQLVYQVERTMTDAKDKLPMELGREVSTALEGARSALKQEDASAWATAEHNLMEASKKMAEHLYQSSSTGPTPGADGPGAGPGTGQKGTGAGQEKKKDDDNVIDADWSEAN